MPCGWEGNRRSGVALAMRHRLQAFIHLRAHGLRKGDEHSAYAPHGIRDHFTLSYGGQGRRKPRFFKKNIYVFRFIGFKVYLLAFLNFIF